MILSDAIIIGMEDARHLCRVIGLAAYDKKLGKKILPEQHKAYMNLKDLVQEMEERRRNTERMDDAIRDIQKVVCPEQH